MRCLVMLTCVLIGGMSLAAQAAPPMVEPYLLEGKLADGAKAIEAHLAKTPADDEARFGLGVIRFLQSFEHLGAGLYKHGLRSERAFGRQAVEFQRLFPQNPKPETLTYAAVRKMLQTWLDDLAATEAVLAKIRDPNVKLPLHVAMIKIDPLGVNQPVSAAVLLGQFEGRFTREEIEAFAIAFDRGDVNWLRGYCHLLAAWGEVLLAVDGQQFFDCTAHLLFEKVDSPHKFLQEDRAAFDDAVQRFDTAMISDFLAFLKLLRFPIKEPARMQAALAHLEGTVAQGKEMWTYIGAESDDDREWIPNPRQKSVVQVQVTESMLETWKSTLDEAELVLQGKRLIPFWRGSDHKRGVNLRRVFTEPKTIDPFLWFQGTGATPYLETGPITPLAGREMLNRISTNFGGPNFFGFMFWFN